MSFALESASGDLLEPYAVPNALVELVRSA